MYNIKSVAKMLEMPAVTIRAWERRYQVVNPTRSESGHRLYSEQDIEDLRWLKKQTEEQGISISQAVKLLEKIREQREGAAKQEPPLVQNFEDLQEQLQQALITFDTERAQMVANLGFSMFSYEEMFHQVFVPVMKRIGDEWTSGSCNVAQEHFASHFVMQRCLPFLQVFPIHAQLPKVLAYCPEPEVHHFGLLLFALFLRRHALDVIYLGPNTPPADVAEVIERHQVRLVAMSLSDPQRVKALALHVAQLAQQFPTLQFALGGQGLADAPAELQRWVVGDDVATWHEWYARMAAFLS